MSHDEIQFGDVEEEKPRTMRRPDEDPHFRVLPCGAIREGELPIYVDLDCMLDMEEHALSNPDVELGGVMLGGQYTDSQGQAFVVVTDSLRAEHYESTRGSFKFTHDTWSQITRRLETYSSDVRMVGWYHTHPDWGVFLSGMDLFICDHFFNKPLDLALVIDPCRQDRGWFRWTGQRGESPQRTGGFYLYGSRFRAAELEHYSHVLEGNTDMPAPLRSGGSTAGGFGAPVVNVVADRSQWPMVAMMGMLTLQTVLIALLVWQALRGSQDQALVEILKRQQTDVQLNARRETLDDIAQLMVGSEKGFVEKLEESKQKSENLKTQLEVITADHSLARATLKKQEEKLAADKKEREGFEKRIKDYQEKLATLESEARAAAKAAREAGTEGDKTFFGIGKVPAIGIGLAVAALLLGVYWLQVSRTPVGFVEDRPRVYTPEADPPIASEVNPEPPPSTNR
jgi:proteasome lid subunit RPN8/RPN11